MSAATAQTAAPVTLTRANSVRISGGTLGRTIRTATSPAGTVEYRFGRKLFFIGPSYGLLANTDKALMGYVGAYLDASYGNLYLTPQLAIGGYKEGDSRNLGGIFQFRASGDLTWRFENGLRVGLRLAHVSNANTSDPNPGEEELYLICSLRLGPYL